MEKSKIPETKMHKLYAISNYDFANNNFIKTKYKEYNLENILEELENDHGYHMRINSDESYIFYGDCDWFRGSFDEFSKLLIKFLSSHYDIKLEKNEISHTINKDKCGSFHYSIPKIYGSAKKLKEIHSHFFNKHRDIFQYTDDNGKKTVVD